MAVLIEKRKKAQLAMDQAQQTIDSMLVRAKTDGIIAVSANRDGCSSSVIPGWWCPDYREGDNNLRPPGGGAAGQQRDRVRGARAGNGARRRSRLLRGNSR